MAPPGRRTGSLNCSTNPEEDALGLRRIRSGSRRTIFGWMQTRTNPMPGVGAPVDRFGVVFLCGGDSRHERHIGGRRGVVYRSPRGVLHQRRRQRHRRRRPAAGATRQTGRPRAMALPMCRSQPAQAAPQRRSLHREETGRSQEALAGAADLDATSIRGLERGTSNPTWDVADRVARALGLPLHELARMADELETADHRPTNQPLRQRD